MTQQQQQQQQQQQSPITHIEHIVSRIGDPTVLEDHTMMHELMRNAHDVTIMRITAICIAQALGFIVTDNERGMLSDDDSTIDYGYGPGAAISERAHVVMALTSTESLKKSARATTVMDALYHMNKTTKMISWVVEWVVALFEDWTLLFDDPIPGFADAGKGDEVFSCVRSLLFATDAPPFVQFITHNVQEVLDVYGNMNPQRQYSSSNSGECPCMCPWLCISRRDTKVTHYMCLITVLSGNAGCMMHCITNDS